MFLAYIQYMLKYIIFYIEYVLTSRQLSKNNKMVAGLIHSHTCPTATALDPRGQYFKAHLRMLRIHAPTKERKASHVTHPLGSCQLQSFSFTCLQCLRA